MNRLLQPFRDVVIMRGMLILAISLLVFCVPFFVAGQDSYFPVFMICFGLSLTFFFLRRLTSGKDPARERDQRILGLVLFLVSAFALNRCMDVFATSPVWLSVVLLVCCANYGAAYYFESMPAWGRYIVLGLLGIATLLFTYYAIYLIPIYAISVPGMILFGVSIHSFIPLMLVYQTIRKTSVLAGRSKQAWGAFSAGLVGCVLLISVYCIAWDNRVSSMNRVYDRALAEGDGQLPAWMQVAQHLRKDNITEHILKTKLVYQVPDWNKNSLFDFPTVTMNDLQPVHDPLVVMANLFSSPLRMERQERIDLLLSSFVSRHHNEERLWSGTDLTTEAVHTQVRTWPAQHLAYTEQIVTVVNHRTSEWRPEEAIYTFHLPEGSVVSALSLWINGVEAPAVLTTKEKAERAYRTIVGVEQHDPSVAHWQEGNRVTVRVFPVSPGDRRQFRIGITSPLSTQNGELVYRSAWMEGPDHSSATETVEIRNDGGVTNQEGGQVAFRGASAEKVYEGSLRDNWEYRIPDPGLSGRPFAFGGNRYTIHPLRMQDAIRPVKQVCLDLNNAWTRSEFDAVLRAAGNRPVWVEDGDLVRVTSENRDALFAGAAARRFSLFPFFRLADPANMLVVTKAVEQSPGLADIKNTGFHQLMRRFSMEGKPVLLFNLGDELSGYLKGLADFRCFEAQRGTIEDLERALASGRFRLPLESDDRVALPGAGLEIVREPGGGDAAAPDHLMRLFSYNYLMRQYGSQGIDNTTVDSNLVAEAKRAHIVTPVSSLVVLETAADYDRFGIDQKQKGLANATLHGSGAVPEPHEWALIVLVLIVAVVLYFRLKMVA